MPLKHVTVLSKVLVYLIAILVLSATSIAYAPVAETFVATAYSLRGKTASGTPVAVGIVAADPRVLRLGTRIHIDAPGTKLDGFYTVRDTGKKIIGKRVDVWMPSRKAALQFGKRKVLVTRLP